MNQVDYRDAFSRITPSDAFREQLMVRIQQEQPAQAGPAKPYVRVPVMSPRSTRIWAACTSGALLMLLFIGIRLMVSSISPVKPTMTEPAPVQTSSVVSPATTAVSFATSATSATTAASIATAANGTNPGVATSSANPTAIGTSGATGVLPYSSLKLIDSAAVLLPSQLMQGSLVDRMRPGNYADGLKERANLVVKATVTQIRLKQYPVRFQVKPSDYKAFLTPEENKYRYKTIHTVIFNVKIDDIYRDAGPSSTSAGDSFVIEQALYPMDSDDPYVLPRTGRQYVFNLGRRETLDLIPAAELAQYDGVTGEHMAEGKYYLLDDQTPQIERTLDGGYLFYADPSATIKGSKLPGAGWTPLINSNSKKITMPDSANPLYRNSMWYRIDSGFEADLKALLN